MKTDKTGENHTLVTMQMNWLEHANKQFQQKAELFLKNKKVRDTVFQIEFKCEDQIQKKKMRLNIF